MSDVTKALVSYCQEQNRICPLPQQWNRLWELLPNRSRKGAGWLPALPLILAAWDIASDDEKQRRLEYHIDWAAEYNALDAVVQFLHGLREDEWFHRGE